MKSKLRKVGTSTGLILPKEALHHMHAKEGDTLFLVKTPEGCLLTPYDPEVEEQVKLGLDFMAKYRDTFRALAK